MARGRASIATCQPGPEPDRGPPRLSREATLVRVQALLDQHGGRPLHVADLCKAARVSERTLRSLFLQAFDVGPGRYLRVRRLYLIQAALAVADPRHETVAGVARRFGCSDGGRMASDYHALFGEYPRATLLRGVNEPR